MDKFILSVGLNDKDTKTQLVSEEDAKELIFRTCKECTVYRAEGGWTYNDGAFARENTLRVELFGKVESEVKNMCKALKEGLNQEMILVDRVPDNSFLV